VRGEMIRGQGIWFYVESAPVMMMMMMATI